MEALLKLNAQTVGRDKLARLIQYFSRIVWHNLQQRKLNPYTVDKVKSLEYTFSTFRKLLRFGKCVDILYSALKTIHYEDMTLRLTCTFSKLATSLFLLTDHILWIGRTGLATVDTNKWANISNKYWLYSIIMNLTRDVYEIMKIVEAEKWRIQVSTKALAHAGLSKQVINIASIFVNDHKDVFWDTVKNGCDVWIPLTALGYTKLKPGTVGVLGTISSMAGLISMVVPHARLLPA